MTTGERDSVSRRQFGKVMAAGVGLAIPGPGVFAAHWPGPVAQPRTGSARCIRAGRNSSTS
jgi:hypothetical protein